MPAGRYTRPALPATGSPSPLDVNDAAAVADVLRRCAELNLSQKARTGGSIHLGKKGTLVATGDLHDHGPNLQRITKYADLDAGKSRHLILHEVIHGENLLHDADLSVRTLARVAELKVKYPDQVHLLQSNHELAQMLGEGIMKDGISSVEAFDEGLAYLYGDDAEDVAAAVDEYVDSLALCVRCGNGVMVAHSLPAPRRIEDFDKDVLDREITDEDLSIHGSAYDMVWGRYQNKKIMTELAEAWGVSVFVLGHQPAEMGYEPLGDNGIILASDHGHGQLLPIDLSATYERDELIELLVPINSIRLD